MNGIKNILGAIFCGGAILFSTAVSAAPEYLVKAAFLINITEFVVWPVDGADSKRIICIIGKNPFNDYLERLLEKENISDIEVVYSERDSIPEGCHVAFVSRSEIGRISSLEKTLRKSAILTISDIHNFARQEGIVELSVGRANKVEIFVNLQNADKVNLKIKSDFVNLATVVNG